MARVGREICAPMAVMEKAIDAVNTQIGVSVEISVMW